MLSQPFSKEYVFLKQQETSVAPNTTQKNTQVPASQCKINKSTCHRPDVTDDKKKIDQEHDNKITNQMYPINTVSNDTFKTYSSQSQKEVIILNKNDNHLKQDVVTPSEQDHVVYSNQFKTTEIKSQYYTHHKKKKKKKILNNNDSTLVKNDLLHHISLPSSTNVLHDLSIAVTSIDFTYDFDLLQLVYNPLSFYLLRSIYPMYHNDIRQHTAQFFDLSQWEKIPYEPTQQDIINKTKQTVLLVEFILKPTDPDFISLNLLPDGLHIGLIYVYSQDPTYNQSTIHDHTSSVNQPTVVIPDTMADSLQFARSSLLYPGYGLSVVFSVTHPAIPSCILKALRCVFSIELTKGRHPGSVYHALKRIDRSLDTVFRYGKDVDPEGYHLYCKHCIMKSTEWTRDEQERLEEAIIWYQRIIDPKIKWNKIATFVGSSRTAKECVERYTCCREFLLKKKKLQLSDTHRQNPIESLLDNEVIESFDPDITQHMSNVKDDYQTTSQITCNVSISLHQLQLQQINLGILSLFKCIIQCDRCHTLSSECHIRLMTFSDNQETQNQVFKTTHPSKQSFVCIKCHTVSTFICYSVPFFSGSNTIVQYQCIQGQLVDILPSDYLVQCEGCSTVMLLQSIFTAMERSCICRICHLKLSICFESIVINGINLKKSVVSPFKKPIKIKELYPIKLGTNLPLNGTCKHYKKSYRWFRFPCCGRAFPCDICHDKESDHPFEHALRMICGYCSKEQPCSGKPCQCGHTTTASHSSHWEGGKGCRDVVQMSRKDDKKYKLLSHIVKQQGLQKK